ncbi:MAG TPA: Gfo/Idh/MocA family oxidoreductase [Devosia sp.]|nr:Gfo/Idh/MocA family oxidoreductase [Devosia sp.]
MTIHFAAIGITHDHINGMTQMLLDEGAVLSSFHAEEDDLAADYMKRFPQARRVGDRRAILEDGSIALVLTSAVPADRAAISIAAMRAGKDVLSDKPGMISLSQLDEVRRAQRETGRIFSVLYSEHFERKSVVRAGELVAAGAIGRVINVVGLGPHRLRPQSRKPYFFDRARYGGILTDIGSHQLEQFLFFTGATEVEVVSATVANRAHPQWPGLQDFGELSLRAPGATGFVRVDWFTPDGLATWGDGRLFVLGTEGYIELRKYVDIAGRPGDEHLFLVDGKGTRHIDCADVVRPFGRQLIADVLNRTETAMPQWRCYKAMELAITAQTLAERGTEWQQ